MDAIVQFLRNFLCCIKDLGLFPESRLYDESISVKFFHAPEPINLTTPLEYLICITQFYAFASGVISGIKMLTSRRYQRLERLLVIWGQTKKEGDKASQRIISESLIREMEKALRNLVVGLCVFPLGFAFLWLAANSLHITSTNWIGGLPALIHALEVMEIFLLPLLYFMWTDAGALLRASKRMLSLKKKIDHSNGQAFFEGGEVNAVTYNWLVPAWSPFWKTDDMDFSNQVQLEKLFATELKTIDANVKELSKTGGSKLGTNASFQIEIRAWKSYKEGQREYIYFVLNFIAFYGYLLGIIAYYYPDGVENYYTGLIKLGMTSSDADWYGNFVGDFMWTIEPLIIIASPYILAKFSPKPKIKAE